jgi:hypothetical protein
MNSLDPSRAVPHDLSLLRDHMQRCARDRSPLHRLHALTQAIDSFLAPRFVTTLAMTVVILAGVVLVV